MGTGKTFLSAPVRECAAVGAFSIFCILLNYAGKRLAEELQLPLWLDALGTAGAAYALGPACGAVVGLAGNVAYGIEHSVSHSYAAVGAVIGVIIGFAARRGWLETVFGAMSASMSVAVASIIFSLPLNVAFLHGMTGNLWGDGVIDFLQEQGLPRLLCMVAGEFYIDFLDKVITLALLFMAVRARRAVRRGGEGGAKAAAALLAVLALPAAARAQDFGQYTQTVYNSANGLPCGEANDIAQTNDGILWIGTYSGLYRYNGSRFRLMSDYASVRNVSCLFVDEEGRLWIGTNDRGVAVSVSGRVVNVIDTSGGLPADSVHCIARGSDGRFYVGTPGGMAMYWLDDGLQPIGTVEGVYSAESITTGRNGLVAVVTANGRLYLIRNGIPLSSLKMEDGSEQYTCCTFGDDGLLYVGTSRSHIYRFAVRPPDGAPRYEPEPLPGPLSCGSLIYLNRLYCGGDGRIFVCAGNGVGYFDGERGFRLMNTGGFNNSIDCMVVDYQGNYWFASPRQGLLRLTASAVTNLYYAAGMEPAVANSVALWNGAAYVGTDDGLAIIRDGRQVRNALTAELAGIRIRSVLADSAGKLWLCTQGRGALEVAPDGAVTAHDAQGREDVLSPVVDLPVGNFARAAIELSNGVVAVASENGVSFLRDGMVVRTAKHHTMLGNATVLSLMELDEHTVLAGTNGDGLAAISDAGVVRTLDMSDGLTSPVILRTIKDGDTGGVFIVTSNSLCYMDGRRKIRELDNFPYYNNYDVWPDGNGRLFVPGSAGIYVVDRADLLAGRSPLQHELLDARSGLNSPPTGNAWHCEDEAGLLYLACGTGVYTLDLDGYNSFGKSYRMMVSSIALDNVPRGVNRHTPFVIDRKVNKIEIFPEIINYTTNNPTVRYWLDGFDTAPTDVSQGELAGVAYTNLPAGDYTFHLAVLDGKTGAVFEQSNYQLVKERRIYDERYFAPYMVLVAMIAVAWLTWLVVRTQLQRTLALRERELEFERKQMEERERRRELEVNLTAAKAASKAKGDFLSSISHEIRTPINAVLGLDEMILRESADDAIRGYAGDIQSAGRTLLSLINDVLDFSKIEAGKMDIIPVDYDLSSTVNDLVNMVAARAEKKGLAFTVRVDPEMPYRLHGDETRIKQCVLNILTNAVKYTREGSVTLEVGGRRSGEGAIALSVSVADTGIGIKPEDLEKLYKPFERIEEKRNRNIEGTGLGMSIVNNLLSLMGTRLDVRSVYGEGSTFAFTVEQGVADWEAMGDFAERHKASVKGVRYEESFQAPDAKILVVDDTPMNLSVVKGLLKRTRIQIDTAESGEAGIRLARATRYDVLFIDHLMPKMDGLEMLAALSALDGSENASHGVPAVALTANAIAGAREMYLEHGFADYLSKPVSGSTLEAALIRYLPAGKLLRKGDAGFVAQSAPAQAQAAASDPIMAALFGLDSAEALRNCGSAEVFRDAAQGFYDAIAQKADMIAAYCAAGDWRNYTVQVHALKSSARLIGARELSALAAGLEAAGNRAESGDAAAAADIAARTPALLADYRAYLRKLAPLCGRAAAPEQKPAIPEDQLADALSALREAVSAFDFDTADAVVAQLDGFQMPEAFAGRYAQIRDKISAVDQAAVLALLDVAREGGAAL